MWRQGESGCAWRGETTPSASSGQNGMPVILNEKQGCGRVGKILGLCAGQPRRSPHPQGRGSDLWLEFPFSEAYLRVVEAMDGGGDSEKTLAETLAETLVKTPVKILAYLEEHPNATLDEVAKFINKSKSAVERAASKLRKEGRLRYVGARKGGHWEVVKGMKL